MFKGKTVLITGGTGSFGNQMVHYLLKKDCQEIRIFSRDENKQDGMRTDLNNPRLKFFLGDIREKQTLDEAMRGVDLVFHAAALKQVPSCEFFPMEAVKTNVLGSRNVIQSAVEHRVQSLVCLSTDKAVYPVNTMGMSKALMEKTAQAASRELKSDDTIITCVRYGNVIHSRGSVIPLFIKQIREGKPLTVTEPTMTRFFMTLENAIHLVEFAFAKGQQGDLFIRKAPASDLNTLVEAVKRVFKAENPVDIIGMRHSEKMHETLANQDELSRAEDLGDFYRIKMDNRDLNYEKYLTEGEPARSDLADFSSKVARQLSVEEIEQLLLSQPEIQDYLKEMNPG
ncbi:MAG: SDR family NAD(P)-dependent oxidoreductase [Candidatus Nitronauta litoralis]|uniref:UDP-glucose 4-epimerase n=1 Tax=Candidatus Nitronauta litoralis TaxID=2705533 RepID=A0A7T0BWE8_9BACT|nr:MAG: SDR family NAD(P)-dependent oxidoreductase [Candidatus Nitronauta litoralis]